MKFADFKRDIKFIGNDSTLVRFVVEKYGDDFEANFNDMDFVNKHGVIVALRVEENDFFKFNLSVKELLETMEKAMGRRRNIVFEVDINKDVYAAELVSISKVIGENIIEVQLEIKED